MNMMKMLVLCAIKVITNSHSLIFRVCMIIQIPVVKKGSCEF